VATRETYEFGDFRLDPARRRLERKDGETVALNAKAFDALVLLVEHAGKPVPRKALIDALWPDTVVEENNLTQAISALRRALGDGYIATLAGRGYQFVAEVRPVAPGSGEAAAVAAGIATPPVDTAAAPPRSGRGRFSALHRGGIALGVVLAAVLGAWLYVSGSTGEQASPTGGGAGVEAPTRILVLPFDNLSSDPEQQAFTDGLTDELIISLQQLPDLRVTGRTTSFALRDSDRSIAEIAGELGVQYVFEAGVGRDGDRLRVRGQLSDASGFGVWPYTYEGALAKLFDVQDDIVRGIAGKLRATLGDDRALRRAGTESLEAYRLYLAAQLTRYTLESRSRGIELLEQALQIDPGFAEAWSWKSAMHSIRYALVDERGGELAAAEAAALRAIELAPDQGDGYGARATVAGIRADWRGAERDYLEAHRLGFTETSYGLLLLSAGHFERALERLEERLDSDPLNADLFRFLMLTHEMRGDSKAADAVYTESRQLFDEWRGDGFRSWIRLGRGEVEELTAPDPQLVVFAQRGDHVEGLALVSRLAEEPRYHAPAASVGLAVWAAHFGDAPFALTLLRRATSESAMLMYLAWLPVFEEVRQLPEFKDLLTEIGLVDYWRATGWPSVCRPGPHGEVVCG
jgi:TolB-like protein/DNA-binding winged helix-turn-helix (wHTH) protein/Tfp pilus assembly protein PilF